MEMCTGDFDDMGAQQSYAMTIKLDGVTLVASKCFDEVFASCYSHVFGPYNSAHPAWMNYTWRVFKASGPTAMLTVSDWAEAPTATSPGSPGGPIGQRMMHNFIQVQPYFE